MTKSLTSYDILNITADASQNDVDRAYRSLAMAWHPDKHQNNGKRDIADRNFKLLQEAYRNVKTPEARSKYNQQLSTMKRKIMANQSKVMNDNKPLSSFLNALDRVFGPSASRKD